MLINKYIFRNYRTIIIGQNIFIHIKNCPNLHFNSDYGIGVEFWQSVVKPSYLLNHSSKNYETSLENEWLYGPQLFLYITLQ
jgi:hypothetical protein